MTKSRATVDLALQLVSEGYNLSEVSRRTGAGRATIRAWLIDPVNATRDRGVHDPGDACHLIDALPRHEYSYLLGQYLGDGCLSRGPRDVFKLRIATCDDYPVIRQLTIDAIYAVMPNNKVGVVQRVGCSEVYSHSKHWPCLFPQHGPGRKHERVIALDSWQEAIVYEHPMALVAGLIHADGCRSTNVVTNGTTNKRYEYARYFFTNVSDDIRSIFCDALDLLGVAWRQNRWNCISVAQADSVAILDSFIGPKT